MLTCDVCGNNGPVLRVQLSGYPDARAIEVLIRKPGGDTERIAVNNSRVALFDMCLPCLTQKTVAKDAQLG